MRKSVIFMLLIVSSLMFAQSNAAAIKIGGFAPSAVDAMGFIIGYEGGKHIDENLDVCWSFDWFKKEYEDEKAKNDTTGFGGNVSSIDIKKLSTTTVYDFPIMFSITAKFPVANKVKIFVNGGMGAELLYVSYNKAKLTAEGGTLEEATDWATSWNWRVGTGALYQLGRNSEIFGEFTWHSSEPSYEYDAEINGKKITYERKYDMSGIMLRTGVRYYF